MKWSARDWLGLNIMVKEFIVVDGYNVINSWDEFSKLKNEDLSFARDLLLHKVSEYAAVNDYKGVLVFDAMDRKGPADIEEHAGVTVVYTAENETADSWIERYVYQIAKGEAKVYVVTSDYAVQNMILGSGAYRISSREFKEKYAYTRKRIEEKLAPAKGGAGRNEMEGRMHPGVREHLEKLRRK
jgi:predicted RNA-binding protein with PIN domain